MQYFTYILESLQDGRYYIGQSQDLEKRLEKHNKGYSKYTKPYRPWKLVWCKTFDFRTEAFQLEQKLKAFKPSNFHISYQQHDNRFLSKPF